MTADHSRRAPEYGARHSRTAQADALALKAAGAETVRRERLDEHLDYWQKHLKDVLHVLEVQRVPDLRAQAFVLRGIAGALQKELDLGPGNAHGLHHAGAHVVPVLLRQAELLDDLAHRLERDAHLVEKVRHECASLDPQFVHGRRAA